MLRRLPRLRDDTVTPEQAFGGTFHINETFSQLDTAYTRADHGVVPDPLPCEIYCHSLTDPTILSERASRLGRADLDRVRAAHPASPGRRRRPRPHARHVDVRGAELAEFRSGRTHSGCADGRLGGPVVHRDQDDGGPGARAGHDGAATSSTARLSWPFAEDDEPLDTPARRWGVATAHDRILLCGAGFPPRRWGVGHRRAQRRDGGVGELACTRRGCPRRRRANRMRRRTGRRPAARRRMRGTALTSGRFSRRDRSQGCEMRRFDDQECYFGPSLPRRACNVARSLASSSAARTSGAGSSIASILRDHRRGRHRSATPPCTADWSDRFRARRARGLRGR